MLDFIEGETLLVDKPLGWTSFDVVKKIKNLLRKSTGLKKIKVGHAGTLDPLASGLLIICTGKKTKTIEGIQAQAKEYTGTINLGATTPSYDLETEIENPKPVEHLTEGKIIETAKSFEGAQNQLPPIFSAKKIDGKRAYQLARKGLQPEMKSKSIEIYEFTLERVELPEIDFRIQCSKGTYIRSVAHDYGQKLEVGAYLKALRRTKIGDYHVDNAETIDSLTSLIDQQ